MILPYIERMIFKHQITCNGNYGPILQFQGNLENKKKNFNYKQVFFLNFPYNFHFF